MYGVISTDSFNLDGTIGGRMVVVMLAFHHLKLTLFHCLSLIVTTETKTAIDAEVSA